LGHFIVDPRIRRDLNAALAASPVFRRRQQFPSYPLLAVLFIDEPTFDIAHWARWVAAVRVRTQVNFQETSYYSITHLCYQNDERHRYGSLAFENQCKFLGMFFGGRLGPECLTEAQ